MSLVKSFAIKVSSNVWTVAVGLLTSIVLNHRLGATDYGALLLSYAAAMFCWNFVDLGIGATLSRYLPAYAALKDSPRAAALVRVGWFCLVLSLSVLSGGLWLSAGWVAVVVFRQPQLAPFIQLSVAYLATFSILNYNLQFLQASQSWVLDSWLSALYPTIYLLGCVIVAGTTGHLGVRDVLMVNAVAGILTTGLLWAVIGSEQRRVLLGPVRLTRETLREARYVLVRFGIPMLLTNFMFFLMVWADKVLVSRYRSLTELTYYYVGFAFFNALLVVAKTFHTVLLPYISRVAAETPHRMQAVFHSVFSAFFHMALGISVITFVFIEPVVKVLYGPTYGLAAAACRWLMVVFVLRFLTNAMVLFLLNAFGLGKTSTLLSVVLITCQLGGDLLLVPRYGWVGAVWAGIAAYAVHGLLMALAVGPIRRLFSWRLLIQTCGVGAATIGCVVVAARALPSLQLVTVPLIVSVVSAWSLYPILQERYGWKPAWSPGAVIRWFFQEARSG